MLEHPRPHPDLAGYVLGQLAPDETETFEAHLAACPDCWEEVAQLSGLPRLLEQAAERVEVPPHLRHRTLAAVTRAHRRPVRGRALKVLAAALASVVAVAALSFATRGDPPFEIKLHSPGDGVGSGVAYARMDAHGIELDMRVRGLPVASPGAYYECWYVSDDERAGKPERVSGGTFVVAADGSARVLVRTAADPRDYPLMEVTLEPDDGDPAATGTVVLVSED